MAEERTAGSRRELLVPLLFVVGSTVVTATVYLSLLGALLVILSSMALGGVLDARRGSALTAGRGAARRSVVVWGAAVAISGVWGLSAPTLALVDRLGTGIDDEVMTGAVAGGFLFALPALALSLPALVASVRLARGSAAPSWPYVAGWALIIILFVGGVFCAAALFVDDPSPGIGAAGAAMVAWSVAAAIVNARQMRFMSASQPKSG